MNAELVPNQAQYQPGEPVRLEVRLQVPAGAGENAGAAVLVIWHLDREVARLPVPPEPGPESPEASLLSSFSAAVEWTPTLSSAGASTGLPASGPPPGDSGPGFPMGFGVELRVQTPGGERIVAATAFDVARHWAQAPRYGFVADFSPGRSRDHLSAAWEQMRRLHLNVVQFYDWMHRHHDYLPPAETFIDPLGRHLSLETVRAHLAEAEAAGSVPIAYGAVYGAGLDFAADHPDWRAYTRDGRPQDLAGFLAIMDIAEGSPWVDHLLGEYRKALALGFRGVHVDQYGAPKSYFRLRRVEPPQRPPALAQGSAHDAESGSEPQQAAVPGSPGPMELARGDQAFAHVLRRCREGLGPDAAVIFNCVNNWPIEVAAASPVDALYIEVWPPHTTYAHLRELIHRARELAGYRKQVILAAYLSPLAAAAADETGPAGPPEAGGPAPGTAAADESPAPAAPFWQGSATSLTPAENGALLTTAVIHALGGYHLWLGDGNRALTEAYYPKNSVLRPEFFEVVRRYMDFIVRYTELLSHPQLRDVTRVYAGGVNDEFSVEAAAWSVDPEPGTVWVLLTERPGWKLIHLMHLLQATDTLWNAPKPSAAPTGRLVLRWLMDEDVDGAFAASPDWPEVFRPLQVAYASHARGQTVELAVEGLERWAMVAIRLREDAGLQ